MAEAMATGTPVVAARAGSVPEEEVDGVTGIVADTMHDMAEAIPRVKELDRRACRAHVERQFSPRAMIDGYERAYASITAARTSPAGTPKTGDGAGPLSVVAEGREMTGS
jgi:glycosyltransferase involved in cell wall biosynthesis